MSFFAFLFIARGRRRVHDQAADPDKRMIFRENAI